MAKVEEFLNPKSMVTPGIAGTMVMGITNALALSFRVPEAATALVLSFLVALISFSASKTPLWQRGVLYVINGLVVFSIAVGTNTAGRNALPAASEQGRTATVVLPSGAAPAATDSALSVALGPQRDKLAIGGIRHALASGQVGVFTVRGLSNQLYSVSIGRPDTTVVVHEAGQPPRPLYNARAITVTQARPESFFRGWSPGKARPLGS